MVSYLASVHLLRSHCKKTRDGKNRTGNTPFLPPFYTLCQATVHFNDTNSLRIVRTVRPVYVLYSRIFIQTT